MSETVDAKPYALADGEGRTYEWHGVLFTIKAASEETGGALAFWDVTTRKGEEPHTHEHQDVDEIFYVLSGSVTFHCDGKSFDLSDHGFVFLPRGIPHGYTINSDEVRLVGLSTPSGFGDHIEQTGRLIDPQHDQKGPAQR